MKLPFTSIRVELFMWTPLSPLSAMTFRADTVDPPIVFAVTPTVSDTPTPEFPRFRVPPTSVPM